MTWRVPERLRQSARYAAKTVRDALQAGTSPERIALGLALGLACGFFPIFGTTTVLAVVVAAVFRVNHVVVQVANYATYPIYFPAVALLIVAGEWLFGGDGAGLTAADLAALQDTGDWEAIFRRAGALLGQATLVWLVLAPPLVLVVRWLVLPWVRRLAPASSG